MTIDEKAHRAVCDKYRTNGFHDGEKPVFFADILETYEAAKQSNFLALLQSPEVVEVVENAMLDCGYDASDKERIRAGLAAITSFIEGDDGTKARTKGNPAAIGQTTLAADAPEADCAQPSPTSYAVGQPIRIKPLNDKFLFAGGQPERLEPPPSGVVMRPPDRQGEALIAETSCAR